MPALNTAENRLGGAVRLLRLLETAGAEQTPVQDGLLIAHKAVQHRFDAALLRECRSQGLIEICGNMVAIRAEGIAFLRRALHPQAGYQVQHGALIETAGRAGGQTVSANRHESPLARLHARRDAAGTSFLNEAAFAAGERLRADFEKAGLQPRISAVWDKSLSSRAGSGGGNEISDLAMDARRRFERAIDAAGPELSGVAMDVCCFLKGLELVERERRWPPRSAKLMLRTGLNILARHYGLAATTTGKSRPQHWGTADFRPQISAGG